MTMEEVISIDNLEAVDSIAETTELMRIWRNIVEHGLIAWPGEIRWKRYRESAFLRSERKVIEEQRQQIIQWIADLSLEIDRLLPAKTATDPERQQLRSDKTASHQYPRTDWPRPVRPRRASSQLAQYVGVNSVQNVEMGHGLRVAAEEFNDWDKEQAFRETEKKYPSLLMTLVILERQ